MSSYIIIMHVYNEAEHLRHVFDAFVRQTKQPSKVIVVDDNSTDNTPDIIQEYGYIYEKVEPPSNYTKPQRRANAFNVALNLAKQQTPEADYVLKVDGDTMIGDTYAEQTINYMENNPMCGACSGISSRVKKTRDLNNGAVLYRLRWLPKAKLMYGWDREIQLDYVRSGFKFHVIQKIGYHDLRVPTVGYSPGIKRVFLNRIKSKIAELQGKLG